MTTCLSCGHPVREHSREDGIGCLHVKDIGNHATPCPCTEPGTSEADQ